MDEHCIAKLNKPDPEGQIFGSIYTRFLRSQTRRDRSRIEDRYWGWEQGRWKMRSYYSMGTQFLSGSIKSSGNKTEEMVI